MPANPDRNADANGNQPGSSRAIPKELAEHGRRVLRGRSVTILGGLNWGRAFNSSQQNALPDQGKTFRECLRLSTTPIERQAANYACSLFGCGFLDEFADSEVRSFMYRCVFVPYYCAELIRLANSDQAKPVIWFWEHACCKLALERLYVEEEIHRQADECKTGSPHIEARGGVPMTLPTMPPTRALDLFPNPSVDYRTLAERFSQWRTAAQDSCLYYCGQHAAETLKGDTGMRRAALQGYLQKVSPLSGPCLQAAQRGLNREQLSAFHQNAIKPKGTNFAAKNSPTGIARRKDGSKFSALAFDTWLIEIWPLVRKHRWIYCDIADIAEKRSEDWRKAVESTGNLGERCGKLGLWLARSGGPSSNVRGHPLGEFAARITSFGEGFDKWARGMFVPAQ